VAAYFTISFPADGLAPLAARGLDIVAVALVAVPAYVCPAAATPIAAVLVAKGMSPGAVLVGLLLGPASNVATIAMLVRAYGSRATAIGLAALAILACALGFAVNAIAVPVDLPTRHEHGAIAWASLLVLVAALATQLWRWGLGPWLEILDAGAHLDGHDHDHDH
jgi:uncharacterized protein